MKALCMGCLSYVDYDCTDLQISNDEVVCKSCGSELCFCPGCLKTGELLLSGCRDKTILGVSESVKIDVWTPESGC